MSPTDYHHRSADDVVFVFFFCGVSPLTARESWIAHAKVVRQFRLRRRRQHSDRWADPLFD